MATPFFRYAKTACLASGLVLLAAPEPSDPRRMALPPGAVPRTAPSNRPSVRAAFLRESYPPHARAKLILFSGARGVRLQLFRAGTEHRRIAVRDAMLGTPVTRVRWLGVVRRGRRIDVHTGTWPSGLYFARLVSQGGRVGYAPFVLRPRRLGESRVAVVLPTQTWQAYNFSDDDGDGAEDTWYAGGSSARTARPYENRGVPTNYHKYDQPFLCWLEVTGRQVDFLAQSDLNRLVDKRALSRAYDLIVFPGHHEYVTRAEYDAIAAFRDRGGNLMFLSANNFFWKVTRRRNLMTRIQQWRKLGRAEASLVGVQYFAGDRGTHKVAWIVRDAASAGGLLADAGLRANQRFGRAGIEVDSTTARSPAGIRVLAVLPWRAGKKGQMTYYETRRGAKVFAAGAISLVSALYDEDIERVLDKLWQRLSRP